MKKYNICCILLIISLLLTSCLPQIKTKDFIEYNVPLESLVVELNADYEYIVEEDVELDETMKYATFSQTHEDKAKLYKNKSYNDKHFTVCINPGHAKLDGKLPQTYAHPDKSPKLIQGSSNKGEVMSSGMTVGTTFLDGQFEYDITLKIAMYLKDMLLSNGYSVLMIRETNEHLLDNVGRSVIANNYSDIHVSLHFDSTDYDKGIFYIKAPSIQKYLNMEPVKYTYEESNKLGEALLSAFAENEEKIFKSRTMGIDLTQMSYSTIPNVDIELGDKATDISDKHLYKLAECLYYGIVKYYEENNKIATNSSAFVAEE